MTDVPNNPSQNLWRALEAVEAARDVLTHQVSLHRLHTAESTERRRVLYRHFENLLPQLRRAIHAAGQWEEAFSTFPQPQQQQ